MSKAVVAIEAQANVPNLQKEVATKAIWIERMNIEILDLERKRENILAPIEEDEKAQKEKMKQRKLDATKDVDIMIAERKELIQAEREKPEHRQTVFAFKE